MKRLVLSGSKYNDGDVYVYGAAVTRVILYLFIITIFFRPDRNAGVGAVEQYAFWVDRVKRITIR